MENFSLYTFKALTALSLTVALTACGGGSSSSKPVSGTKSSAGFSSTIPASSKAASSKTASSKKASSIAASSVTFSAGQGEASSSATVVASSADASSIDVASSSEVAISSEEASSSEIASSSEVASSSEEASSSEIASSSEEASSSEVASSSDVSSSVASSSVQSSSSGPASIYHVRGTHNNWVEGLLMTRVGTTDSYQSCINFTATGENSFKVDPNGAWGADAVPAQNYVVSKGWVKILFNSTTKTVTAEQNLGENCQASFHLRGTHTATPWAEGDLFTPVANSATNYEICRNFAKGDAGGGPRFKVDPNGAWGADAFPAADTPANGWTKIVINSSTKTIVSKDINLTENCGGVAASSSSAASSTGSTTSSSSVASVAAADFRARTTYFMFVDRFANSDTSNDKGLNPTGTVVSTSTDPLQLNAKADIKDWKKYWGGDIQGILDKLDYLQALGITAIWVTPLVDNVNDTGTEGIYHGYQARDFYSVDEHLGDWALVDKLDAEMEKRNMKLVLDIALNHSNHTKMGEFGALFKDGMQIIKDFNAGKGEWYHDRTEISDCDDVDPKTVCDDEWKDLEKVQNKMLFNLADFVHGKSANSKADEYLIGAAKKWMAHGVDAFRIDAIKHLEPSFVNRFTAAVRAEAAATGKAEPYVFGEWYDAGATDPASMAFLNERRGSELLDFKLRDNIERSISGEQSMKLLNTHVEFRPSAMNGKDNLQPIFLDNHDAQRTSVFLQTTSMTNRGTGKGMAKAEADSRQNLGMALVMTLPGVPVVYYGSEQNTAILNLAAENKQIGSDPFNREMMPSFDQSKPAFKLISALAKLRLESPAIQRGTYKQLWVNDDILVFERREGNDCAIVAVNRGPATSIDVQNLCLANASYTSLVGTETVNVASGTGKFNLPQRGAIVLH